MRHINFTYLSRRFLTSSSAMMSASRNVTVTVKQGGVIGQEEAFSNGGSYYSFKGIPYAQPPIGKLRFKPPVPLDKFPQATIDCRNERNKSFQNDPTVSGFVGSEDCLFLNVYTPRLKSDKPLPVMVWIHGGAFMLGSGDSDFFFPEYLIKEDVVVVTLNYRLGMFGFLYAPDGGVPGNAALNDQLLALKWVAENIDKFNGDPNNVTLFGHSAGAASAHLHLLSNKSRIYFHKAIFQSGLSNMEWAIQKNPRERTRRLAKLMGFESESEKDIVRFLTETHKSIDIYKHILATLTPDEKRRGLPIPFKPVVEGELEDSVVPKPPLETLKEINSFNIPVMMGYTSHEGITMLVNAIKKLDIYDKDLARLIPTSVDLDPEDPRCMILAEEIRKFYFNGEQISKKTLTELGDLMSDYHFVLGMHIAAEIHAKYQHKSPLYFYRFAFNGELNLYKKWFKFTKMKGACHGDELFYLFKTDFAEGLPKPGSEEEKITKQMCRMWTNFAKYSDPTPENDNVVPCKWRPVKHISEEDKYVLDYLEIDKNTRMDKDPDKERIDFWRDVYEKYNKNFLNPKL